MTVAAGHTPERICRVCRQRAPKSTLARWTVIGDKAQLDSAKTAQGRGWYVCAKESCQTQIERVVIGQSKNKARKTMSSR